MKRILTVMLAPLALSSFQGMPDDAPCSAIGGCNATNCP
jgi:hypothetical protein